DKNGSARFTIDFSIENSGRSPAAAAQIRANLVPMKDVFSEPLEYQKRLCDKSRIQEEKPLNTFALFPNKRIERSVPMLADAVTISDAQASLSGIDRPVIFLFAIGCLNYRFEFEPGMPVAAQPQSVEHQTGFIYLLQRIEPKYPGAPFMIFPGNSLNAD